MTTSFVEMSGRNVLVPDKATSCVLTLRATGHTTVLQTAFIERSSVTYTNGTVTLFECTVPQGITGAQKVAVSLMVGELKLAKEVLLPLMQEATVIGIEPTWL